MKRADAGDAVDAAHPAACFHREVLTCMKWSDIRRDFLDALQTAPHLRFVEPKKLWRHSQEALGKWVLSQVARDTRVDKDTQASVAFFPTKAMISAGTYDEQLIRDISLKCEASSSPEVVAGIKQLLTKFNLSKRCEDAAAEVLLELESTSPSAYCRPTLRVIGAEEEQSRTASQRRVQGSVAVIGVEWPSHIARHMRRGCPAVSIPLAAYRKLDMCYRHFADKAERVHYPRLDYDARFALRAAALAMRYEGCLATGSLQLCADTRLKQHLHASGYHVMDLCASPINAYMGSPKVCSHRNRGSDSGSFLECEDTPNYFCSAFFDTDRYFGSLGSALKFDVASAYNSREINPNQKPLLLTLDVPYDEDLCEKLFSKLLVDMQHAEAAATASAKEVKPPLPYVADYVLVLPLWWDVPMQRAKVLFTEEGSSPPPPPPASSSVSTESTAGEKAAARLRDIIKERSATLQEGYMVPYEWPQRLAEAAGDRWVSFDGVFVGGSYEYFCTITNKWLSGVTATEVIGLAQPRAQEGGPALKPLLDHFYGCQ
ncbi:hypothetical protein DQ04_08491020 [Trypanosoma grayi]|uniref:hypothetical protein n=1 Tax=Trypanosoma grayi TaxID=71804 RepID=UPI0004F48F8F|nr:hypothetical protein DQ04_08491020 [Trypanosoma grayi]KEG07912.1 hypothetical protein DQ04_08491020 [Trypanosoma grayi]